MKKKILSFGLAIVLLLLSGLFIAGTTDNTTACTDAPSAVADINNIYSTLHLKEMGLNNEAWATAIKGWQKLQQRGEINKGIISICDFTQSANSKRLYVIDLVNGTLLFNTFVAHGKNTGEEFAHHFSNKPESLESSLGFYVTRDAYFGKHGLGLRLIGQEPGFNDKAEERAIVMHGAQYVCDKFIEQFGKLGRSWGCPAVPFELHEQIINTIKGGSCLFIYYPDKTYLASSKLLH
jgi:hypothetical protein